MQAPIRFLKAEGDPKTFFEFFAGGGMARAGLGDAWRCTFANDFDLKKSITYRENWGAAELLTQDVGSVTLPQLPGRPELVWASFPCQDLSLAGMGAGLRGDRSGTFWPFWRLMEGLALERRSPSLIVLENVCGTLTSHEGKDFVAIAEALSNAGYRFGALVVDAKHFVPQSRPRLFVVAIKADVEIPSGLTAPEPNTRWHTRALQTAYSRLSARVKRDWLWWHLPPADRSRVNLLGIIERDPASVSWHTKAETDQLLSMMSPVNLAKVARATAGNTLVVGTVYKRTRHNPKGQKVQRAEVRFDGVAGCLRTSSGGSSRQLILVVEGNCIRSRLLSSREAARLMGLPESYKLPKSYNEAYHLTGDGVVVPVVRHLSRFLLEPLSNANAALVEQIA